LVTTTSATPTVPAGVVHVSDVAETNVTPVQAEPPTWTVAPETNSVPLTVMSVPPPAGPLVGDTPDTEGAAAYVNPPAFVAV
jgi:hypothetical protein